MSKKLFVTLLLILVTTILAITGKLTGEVSTIFTVLAGAYPAADAAQSAAKAKWGG